MFTMIQSVTSSWQIYLWLKKKNKLFQMKWNDIKIKLEHNVIVLFWFGFVSFIYSTDFYCPCCSPFTYLTDEHRSFSLLILLFCYTTIISIVSYECHNGSKGWTDKIIKLKQCIFMFSIHYSGLNTWMKWIHSLKSHLICSMFMRCLFTV